MDYFKFFFKEYMTQKDWIIVISTIGSGIALSSVNKAFSLLSGAGLIYLIYKMYEAYKYYFYMSYILITDVYVG